MKLLLQFTLNATLASMAISASDGEKAGDFASFDGLEAFHKTS